MATGAFNRGIQRIWNGSDDYLTDTIKMALLGTTTLYTYDPDDNFMAEGGANDPDDAELQGVTGYTRGFGNAGRKTLAGKLVTENDTNNRVEIDCDNFTWTTLGAGDTITAAIILKEITNDSASPIFSHNEVTDTPTNGGDVTITIPANGFLNNNLI